MKDLRRILCLELNAVEKYNFLEKVFEAVRDESYSYLVAVLIEKKKGKNEGKMQGRKSGTLSVYSCRYAYKLEESKAYVLVINGHGLYTT